MLLGEWRIYISTITLLIVSKKLQTKNNVGVMLHHEATPMQHVIFIGVMHLKALFSQMTNKKLKFKDEAEMSRSVLHSFFQRFEKACFNVLNSLVKKPVV